MSRMRRIRRKKPRTGSVWKKLLLWGVLGLLVLAAAAVAGSYLYVRAYLKSDGFLAMLEQSAVDDMNVETARIDPLDWDGSGIRCGGVVMEGHEFLTSLQARNIETEFSRWELLKRAFVITSVNIAELKLQLSPVPFRFKEKEDEPKSWVEENILPGMLSQSMQYVQWFAELGGFLVTFLIASVLLAKDYDGIMNRLLDQEACHVLLEVICGIVRYIATFVKAQGIIMTTIAMTAAATLGIAGIKHGILWGILAGILDALPFIGTGVVLVPLGMFQILDGNWGRALVCGVLYVVCIFLREVMEPRLIGRKIGVSPIAVLVSLYAGIRLFGVWGIIKGPLGFVLIYETYHSLARMYDRQREQGRRE